MELEDSCFKYSSYVLYSNRMPCLCLNGTKRIASFLPHSWLNSDLHVNGFLIESAEFSVNAKYHWGPGTTVRLAWLTWPQISRSQNSLTINRVCTCTALKYDQCLKLLYLDLMMRILVALWMAPLHLFTSRKFSPNSPGFVRHILITEKCYEYIVDYCW